MNALLQLYVDGTVSGTSPPIRDCQQWLFDPCDSSTPASTPTSSPPSNTTAFTPPIQTTDGGQGGGIAAGVVFGLLAILGVVAVILVVSILLWKRQKDRGIYETSERLVMVYH